MYSCDIIVNNNNTVLKIETSIVLFPLLLFFWGCQNTMSISVSKFRSRNVLFYSTPCNDKWYNAFTVCFWLNWNAVSVKKFNNIYIAVQRTDYSADNLDNLPQDLHPNNFATKENEHWLIFGGIYSSFYFMSNFYAPQWHIRTFSFQTSNRHISALSPWHSRMLIAHSMNIYIWELSSVASSCVVGRERMGTVFPHKKLSGNGVPTREILRDIYWLLLLN